MKVMMHNVPKFVEKYIDETALPTWGDGYHRPDEITQEVLEEAQQWRDDEEAYGCAINTADKPIYEYVLASASNCKLMTAYIVVVFKQWELEEQTEND